MAALAAWVWLSDAHGLVAVEGVLAGAALAVPVRVGDRDRRSPIAVPGE